MQKLTPVKLNILPLDLFLELRLVHEYHSFHREGTKCIYQDLIKNGCTIKQIIYTIVHDLAYLDSAKYNISDDLKYDHMNHFINCIRYGFRHQVGGWKETDTRHLIDPDYYKHKKAMSDAEIAEFLHQHPLKIKHGDTITDGIHRCMCMMGRIMKGQPYIPFHYAGDCLIRIRRKDIPNVGYRKEHNPHRLKAILPHITQNCFKAVDIGSNYGYFSLNLAYLFPNSQIFSMEGAFGTGNKERKGITTQNIIKKDLGLFNNHIFNVLLDDRLIAEFNRKKIVFDYQLSFSVFHWIVYLKHHNQGTAAEIEKMLINHLRMARVTFIELPAFSQETSLSPLYREYNSLEELFSSLSQTIPLQYNKLLESEWCGIRGLYSISLLQQRGTAFTPEDVRAVLSDTQLTDYSEISATEIKKAHSADIRAVRQKEDPYLVTAIVSTYNSAKFIRGCLQDLIEQTLYRQGMLEIVVINSGSEQNEEQIVHEFMRGYPHIFYIRTERETIYAAWNRGIEVARGKYVTNCNTDDRHRHDALELMSSYLESYPEVDLVYAKQHITDQMNSSLEHARIIGSHDWPPYSRKLLLEYCCIGPQPLWRKSLHSRFGMFKADLEIAGDYEFWLRISNHCRFALLNEYLGLYYKSPQRSNKEFENNYQTFYETSEIRRKYYIDEIRPESSEKLVVKTQLMFDTIKNLINNLSSNGTTAAHLRHIEHLHWMAAVNLEHLGNINQSREIARHFFSIKNHSYRLSFFLKQLSGQMQLFSQNNLKQMVSVIIPVHNLSESLYDTLQHLGKQTSRNMEIIVASDNPHVQEAVSDHTVCNAELNRFLRILPYSPTTDLALVIEAATNSQGNLLAFIFPGDECFPDFLEKGVSEFINNSRLDVLTVDILRYGSENRIAPHNLLSPAQPHSFLHGCIVKKSTWEKCVCSSHQSKDIIFQNLADTTKINHRHLPLPLILQKYNRNTHAGIESQQSICNVQHHKKPDTPDGKSHPTQLSSPQDIKRISRQIHFHKNEIIRLMNKSKTPNEILRSELEYHYHEIAVLLLQNGNILQGRQACYDFYRLYGGTEKLKTIYRRLLLTPHKASSLPLHPPLVTIVIPLYNQGDFLEKAVQSVVNQSYPKWEVVIVNDGSTDNSHSIALSLQKQYEQYPVKVLTQSNKGKGYTRNRGIKNGNGEYICVLDADDMLASTFLETSVAILQKDLNIGWVCPQTLQLGPRHNNIYWTWPYDFIHSLLVCPAPVSAIYRKSLWEDLGGYCETMTDREDWDFWISAGEQGWMGKTTEDVEFIYRKHTYRWGERADINSASKREILARHPWFYRTLPDPELQKMIDSHKVGVFPKEILEQQAVEQLIPRPISRQLFCKIIQNLKDKSKKEKYKLPETSLMVDQTYAMQKTSTPLVSLNLTVQFYVYKNVHWPMFEALHAFLKDHPDICKIIICLPNLPQLIDAQDDTLVDKIFATGATVVANPRTEPVDITFVADTLAGKVAGCGKIVNIGHGTISKGYYFTDSFWTERENWVDLLCVPGQYAVKQFEGLLKTRVAATGMPKLDPVFSGIYNRDHLCQKLGLDPSRKIVLYAPTFNVDLSSVYDFQNCFWQLRHSNYYLLIKLHGSTLPHTIAVYRKMALRFDDILFVDDHNLAPYLGGADIMISDVSSAFMEFMALDRPVILYNNPNARQYHGYHSNNIEYAWRNLGTQVGSFNELKTALQHVVATDDDGRSAVRQRYAAELFADRTGNACELVWQKTVELIHQASSVSLPVFSVVMALNQDNLFAVRLVLHDIQANSVLPFELVLVVPALTPELESFIAAYQTYSQFVSTRVITAGEHLSPEELRLRGCRAASGDYILRVEENVTVCINFDYVIYKTYLNHRQTGALTGLSNTDDLSYNAFSRVPQPPEMDLQRYACELINHYQNSKTEPLRLQHIPPLIVYPKALLADTALQNVTAFNAALLTNLSLCPSLFYTVIPADAMASVHKYWVSRRQLPLPARIQMAQIILKNYDSPDIAEQLLFDQVASGMSVEKLYKHLEESLGLRFYDLAYKQKLLAVFKDSPAVCQMLNQDLALIARLSEGSGASDPISQTPVAPKPVPAGSPISAPRTAGRPLRALFYFFKNVHIPIITPLYRKFKELYPQAATAFGYMEYAPQMRAGFVPEELALIQSVGEPLYLMPQEFKPDITFIADSVYPWVENCGKLVHVGHGVLSKGQYYTRTRMATREELADLVCVPGSYHEAVMREVVSKPVAATGMAKLDALFAGQITRDSVLKQYHLPANQSYILFAPTFNDELSALPVVQDQINRVLPEKDCLLLIKLHGSTHRKYKEMYAALAKADPRVVYMPDLDITPFLALADVLISDVSSVMMEFAALNKPLVLFNNPQREQYINYNPADIEFQWRDIGIETDSLKGLIAAVRLCLAKPDYKADRRKHYTDQLFANKYDGRAAERIVQMAMDRFG